MDNKPSNEYPRWLHHPKNPPKRVETPKGEKEAKAEGYRREPFPPAPPTPEPPTVAERLLALELRVTALEIAASESEPEHKKRGD